MAREAQPKTNGFDAKKLKGYIERVENLRSEIASIMGKAMRDCQQQHEDIKEVMVEAKAAGIPVKALKAELKLRKLDASKADIIAGLEDEDAESLDMIRDALGDFASSPLGEAAMKAAEARATA